MAVSKKNNYIDMELEWLEMKAEQLRAYVDSNPLSSLTDRIQYRETRNGGAIPVVVATIEQQHKNIRDTLKDYALIVDAISKLREKEEQKKLLTRGDAELSPIEQGDI
jgi:hypothetical protein